MFGTFPRLFTGVENKQEHIVKLLYSGLYFAITFILLSYTSHAWSTANAWSVGYHPLFSYDGMDNLVGAKGPDWNVARIAWVYLAPPLWGMMVSLLSLAGFHSVDPRLTHLRTFLFWLSINGFLLFYSYIITGFLSGHEFSSIFFTGFMGFYSWLDWSIGTIFGILVLQGMVFLTYSIVYSKPVMQLNYSRYLAARTSSKTIIFINVVMLPFIFGSILLMLATLPMDAEYQFVRLVSYFPVLVICLVSMGFYKAKHINIVKGGIRSTPLIGFIAAALILVVLSRTLLSYKVGPLW